MLVLGAFSGTLEAQRAAKKNAPPPRGFSPPQVQQAVPGIDAAISLTAEQREKLAAQRKKMMQSEEFQAAMKTARDRSAERADRAAAQKKMREMQGSLQGEVAKALTPQQKELISKINGVVKAEMDGIRTEYREKMRAARGNREEQQKLRKEIGEKTRTGLHEKILALLSDEQKAAVKKAAEELKKGKKAKREPKQRKKGEGKKGRKGKKKQDREEEQL